jgi:Glycosyl hydrolase family 26
MVADVEHPVMPDVHDPGLVKVIGGGQVGISCPRPVLVHGLGDYRLPLGQWRRRTGAPDRLWSLDAVPYAAVLRAQRAFGRDRKMGASIPRIKEGPVERLAIACAFVALFGSSATGGRPPATAVAPGVVPAPEHGAYFGSYSPPESDWSKRGQKNEYSTLEAAIGRTLNMANAYYQWDDIFPSWREPWHLREGRIPMISWAGFDTEIINTGSQDAIIRGRANGVEALGEPVFLRWLWEMNGAWTQPSTRDPSAFQDAWRRIHGIFRATGATNAAFVWCPTAWGWRDGTAVQYYPGDAYVDWICADGYNFAPGKPGSVWRSFSWIFGPFYDWAAPKGKPIIIGEYGAQERNPGEKESWIAATRNTLKNEFPAIKGVMYYDRNKLYDWRVDTSPQAFRAFRRMALDPYFLP